MHSKKVILKDTKKYGKAVFAGRDIQKGEVVAAFTGKIYELKDDDMELPNDPPWYVRDHAIQVGQNKWVHTKGIARYLNHSCEPNCGIKNLVEVVAMRDIKKGEELTWDYDMTEDSDWEMKCRCGAQSCRKVIRGYTFLPAKFKRKYKGYISEWLLS